MKRQAANKLRKIIETHEKVKPKTFLEELAEINELYEYILKYHKERFINDEMFRDEVFSLFYKYADKPMKEVDHYYLEKLIEHLEFFLEYTKDARHKIHQS